MCLSVNKWSHLLSGLPQCEHRSAHWQPARGAVHHTRLYILEDPGLRGKKTGRRSKNQNMKRRRGVKKTPRIELSLHLRPEGAQRGQPSESRTPRTGSPFLPRTSVSSESWCLVKGGLKKNRGSDDESRKVDMLSNAAVLRVVASRDLRRE